MLYSRAHHLNGCVDAMVLPEAPELATTALEVAIAKVLSKILNSMHNICAMDRNTFNPLLNVPLVDVFIEVFDGR